MQNQNSFPQHNNNNNNNSNPKYNGNNKPYNNYHNQPNYNQPNNGQFNQSAPAPIQQLMPNINPVVFKHPVRVHLDEVTGFCQQLKSQTIGLLPKGLTIKQAVEIVLLADRLQIDRLQALKHWKNSNGEVVVSATFLLQLFYRRNMLTKELSSLVKKSVSETFLMTELRAFFPELMMGIICQEEIPPSNTSRLVKNLRNGLEQVISSIKAVSIYCIKKLHSFVGSCIVSDKTNGASSSIPKTTQFAEPQFVNPNDPNFVNFNEDEELFLDWEVFDVVKPKSAYSTTPLAQNTNSLDEVKQTSFIN